MNFGCSSCLNVFSLLSSYLTSNQPPINNVGQSGGAANYYMKREAQCPPWDFMCWFEKLNQQQKGNPQGWNPQEGNQQEEEQQEWDQQEWNQHGWDQYGWDPNGQQTEGPQTQTCSECNSHPLISHYRDSGCKLHINPNTCCPNSADCRFLNNIAQQKSGCHYRGKKYDVGETITEATCKSCVCSRTGISCRTDGCALEWQGPRPTCVYMYNPGECCANDIYCPSKGQRDVDHRCKYNGKTYIEGEKFKTKDPCKECVCSSTFKGVDNKHCTVIPCMLGNSYQNPMMRGCLPIYDSRSSCCPVEFFCQQNNRNDQQRDQQQQDLMSYSENPKQCVFAGRSYAIGANIPINRKCVTCKCEVPPLGTCVMERNC